MNKQYYLSFAMLCVHLSSTAQAVELGGVLKNQNSYNIVDHDWQRQDWQLDLELNSALGEGELTAITRFSFDIETQLNTSNTPDTFSSVARSRFSDKHNQASLRELYWDYQGDMIYWRLGKQQVVWGEADGLKLLDVINPQSYREFILDDFDDARIPLWMVNAEVNVGDDSLLQILWIPDTTTHDLAPEHSPYWLASELIVPQPVDGISVEFGERNAPSKLIEDSDFGLRLSHVWRGWDMTANYLYHTIDDPVLNASLSGATVKIEQDYKRSHLIGGSASNAFGDWTLRTELAYETNRYHRSNNALPGVVQANQWGSVVGLDFQGFSDQFISIQWFQTRIVGHTNEIIKSATEDTASLLWEASFLNDTLTFSWLNLYSIDHHDGVSRPKIRYNFLSNLDLTLSYDRFYGNQNGLFGQFDQRDRLSIGFEWGIN